MRKPLSKAALKKVSELQQQFVEEIMRNAVPEIVDGLNELRAGAFAADFHLCHMIIYPDRPPQRVGCYLVTDDDAIKAVEKGLNSLGDRRVEKE